MPSAVYDAPPEELGVPDAVTTAPLVVSDSFQLTRTWIDRRYVAPPDEAATTTPRRLAVTTDVLEALERDGVIARKL